MLIIAALKRTRSIHMNIDATLKRTRWRLEWPGLLLFTQTFIPAQMKENIKAPFQGLCAGTTHVTSEFPASMASDAENVSIWWRHDEMWRDGLVIPTLMQHNIVLHVTNNLKSVLPRAIYGIARKRWSKKYSINEIKHGAWFLLKMPSK